MRTELVVLDGAYQSKKKVTRALTALGCFIVLSFLWYGMGMRETYRTHTDKVSSGKMWIGAIALALLVVSAISAQLPKYASTALLYGALVGLVIYGSINATLLMVHSKWSFGMAGLDLTWGVVSTTAIAFLTYQVFT